jgi:hypothetical protein
VRTTLSGITFVRNDKYRMIENPNNLKLFVSNKAKVLNTIANICNGHVCLKKENLSFGKNKIFRNCEFQ